MSFLFHVCPLSILRTLVLTREKNWYDRESHGIKNLTDRSPHASGSFTAVLLQALHRFQAQIRSLYPNDKRISWRYMLSMSSSIKDSQQVQSGDLCRGKGWTGVRRGGRWQWWTCCGAVAAHVGMARRLSAIEDGKGQWILALMAGWGWRILEAGVALLFPGTLPQ